MFPGNSDIAEGECQVYHGENSHRHQKSAKPGSFGLSPVVTGHQRVSIGSRANPSSFLRARTGWSGYLLLNWFAGRSLLVIGPCERAEDLHDAQHRWSRTSARQDRTSLVTGTLESVRENSVASVHAARQAYTQRVKHSLEEVYGSLMGYEKNRMMEEDDQGWRYSGDRSICSRCFTNAHLRSFVEHNANGYFCSFCGRRSRKHFSTVQFDEVMEIIAEAVRARFNYVEDENIPWDSEDQVYMGTTFDTDELVFGEIPPFSDRDDVIDHVVDCLGDHLWCQRNFASLTHGERFKYGWESFRNKVQYHTRFLFAREQPDKFEDAIPVAEMLDELGAVVERHGLIRTLPAGTTLSRIRVHEKNENPNTEDQLGPPPSKRALANRMSPAGISLFYSALDDRTARAETFTTGRKQQYGTIAKWATTRELVILDLTRRPSAPSFFDASAIWNRDERLFLDAFTRDISKPVSLDGREHIDYVPTQIVTEYFRQFFTTTDGQRIHGIVYPSARRKLGKCVVVFVGYDSFDPDSLVRPDPPPLELIITSARRVRSINKR